MTCFAYDRSGSVCDNPGTQQMRELLQSMDAAGDQPDVSLNDDDGWSISYSHDKTITLGNAETGEGPWHMKNVDLDQALGLWETFNKGDLAGVRAKPWSNGKG
jgi:hypothetical protein